MKRKFKILASVLSIGLLSTNVNIIAKDVHSVSRDAKIISDINIDDSYIDRAEFATLLITTFYEDDLYDLDIENKFEDVEASDWFFKYILKAYQEDLIAGVSESKFGPQAQITREQMTVMIMRLHNKLTGTDYRELYTTSEIRFEDEEQISEWSKQAVLIASGMGIVKESYGNRFMPKGKVTKREALDMIKKLEKSFLLD